MTLVYRRATISALILAAILAARAALALNPDKQFSQYRMDAWAAKDGLPRSIITAIAQTPDGYLWIGTRLGVARFDGASFSVFNPGNTAGLERAGIGTLAVSPSGDLWIGTDGSGFGIFKPGQYRRFRPVPGEKEWSHTFALSWTHDSRFLVGVQHGTLFAPVFSIRDGRVIKTEQMNGIVHAFAQGRDGTVWCASEGVGVMKLSVDGTSRPELTTRNGLPSADVTSLCVDSEDSLWIGTQTQGVCRYRKGVCTTFTERDGLPSNEINCLYQDREGCVWIGTTRGVARWYKNRFTSCHTNSGQEENPVYAIFEDHEGNIWVGTKSGLIRFADTKLTPLVTRLRNGHLLTLVDQFTAPDGSLVAGTTDSGVVRMNGDSTFDTVLTTANGLPSNNVRALCAQRDGTFWIVLDRCLAWYAHGALTKFPLQSTPYRIKAGGQADLFAIADNAILVFRNGKLLSRQLMPGVQWVFDLEIDRDNALWIATSRGLVRFSDGTVRFAEGWDPKLVALCIAFDPNGKTLWVGTDRGLARYDRRRVRLHTTVDGLPNNNIHGLAFDGLGSLWAFADGGIASLAIRDLKRFDGGGFDHLPARWYTQEDGYTGAGSNGQPLRSRDGRLFFPSPHALTIADSARLPLNVHVPSVVIEAVTANDRLQSLDRPGTVSPGSGSLEVHFAALSFAAPERVRFRYKLQGHDADWIDAGSRRAAYYTNLPPGAYTFQVLACNNDGLWNEQGAAYSFVLRPRFWQTLWFQALALLLIVLAGVVLLRLRLAQLNRQNHVLEQKVAERTAALRSANARLEALATIDGMTGLPNHRSFQERLSAELAHARRHGHAVCVLLMDVDYFKHYNDTYGHPAGDGVLRQVGKLLRDGSRDGDFVARYGGEEFVVILPQTELSLCLDVAERLRSSVAESPFPHRQVTISIGLARHDFADPGGDDLVQAADKALYAAKQSGRNRVAATDEIGNQPGTPGAEEAEIETLNAVNSSATLASISLLDNPEALLQEPAGQVLFELLSALDQGRWEPIGHSVRSARLALRLAQEVSHLDERYVTPGDIQELATGALLHDIGMAAVPVSLDRLTTLTMADRKLLEQHPERGAAMLEGLPHLISARPVVLSHHERWDGSGYPHALAGEEIPLSARIFAVSNAVAAMFSESDYACAPRYEQIRDEIERQAGSQFDPLIVSAFLKIAPEDWHALRGAGGPEARTSMEGLLRAA